MNAKIAAVSFFVFGFRFSFGDGGCKHVPAKGENTCLYTLVEIAGNQEYCEQQVADDRKKALDGGKEIDSKVKRGG